MNAHTESSYLRDVGKRLQTLTPEQREAVLDDVRAHFTEAADAGRSPEEAAKSLGDPAQFTARVRNELGVDPGRTDRIWRVLQWLATGLAVFTAMFVTFLWSDDSLPMPNSQFAVHGFGITLFYLIPALIAAIPLLVPVRVRMITTAAVAIVLTVVSFTIFGLADLTFFLPSAMLAWAAFVTPIIARNGRPAIGWRVAGGALTALPAVLGLVGMLTGSFDMDIWPVVITVASFGLGALIALGKPWAGIILVVGGVTLLIDSALNPGYIVLATWWAGGLFLTLGASHTLAHSRPRTPART